MVSASGASYGDPLMTSMPRSSSSGNLDQLGRVAGRPGSASSTRGADEGGSPDHEYYSTRFQRPASLHSPHGVTSPIQFMPPPSPPRAPTTNQRRISMPIDQADVYLRSVAPFIGKQMVPTRARELPSEVHDQQTGTPMIRFGTIASIARFRARSTPKLPAFTQLDSKGREVASLTYEKLHSRAEKLAMQLRERSGLSRGDNVLLVYKRSEFLESLVALLACFYAGMVAVPLVTSSTNLEDEITESLFIMENCRISLALSTDATAKSVAKDFMATRGGTPKIEWWKTNESSLTASKIFGSTGTSAIISSFSSSMSTQSGSVSAEDDLPGMARPEELAYVEYTKNGVGELKGVLMDHQTIFNHSYVVKGAMEIEPADVILLQLEPRQQFGLMTCLAAVFSGCHTVFIPDLLSDSNAFNSSVFRYKATFAITDNACLVDVVHELREGGRKGSSDFASLRAVLVDSIIPHPEHLRNVAICFRENGLRDDARVFPITSVAELGGVCLSLQDIIGVQEDMAAGYPRGVLELLVDNTALLDGRVDIRRWKSACGREGGVEGDQEESGLSKIMWDSGYPFHGVSVLIVDPDTKVVLPKNCIGEIFVSSLAVFPKGFWALPKLSDQTFRVHPVIYKENDAMFRNPNMNPYASRRSSTLSVISESMETADYIRTGLLGFIADSTSVSSLGQPRLFVAGIRRDMMRQRRTADEVAVVDKKGFDVAVFSIVVGADHLPVVIVETNRSRSELNKLAAELTEALGKEHSLQPFCVAFCGPNALPRLKPDPSTGTGLQTSLTGYTSGVVSVTCGSTKPTFAFSGPFAKDGQVCRKLASLDIELCRSAFMSGEIGFRHLVVSCRPETTAMIARFDPILDAVKEAEIFIPGRGNAPLKVGQVVGGMMDVPVLDDQTLIDLNSFPTISHLLRYRADMNGDKPAYTVLDHKGRESKVVTYRKMSSKVHSLAHYLTHKRGIKAGDYVLLIYPPGLEYLYALHACLYAGIIPIPLSPPDINRLKEDIPALLQLASEFGVKDLLCNAAVEELLRGRATQVMVKAVIQQQLAVDREEEVQASSSSMHSVESLGSSHSHNRPSLYLPNLVNTSKAPKLGLPMSLDDPIFAHAKLTSTTNPSATVPGAPPHVATTINRLKKTGLGSEPLSPTAIVLVNTNPDLLRTVARLSHATLMEQCRIQTIQARILESTRPIPNSPNSPNLFNIPADEATNRPLISCVRSYNGLGFTYSTMLGIYVGNLTIIVPPFDFSNNPLIWFEALHRYQVKDVFATFPMLEHALTVVQDYRSFSLQSVRSLTISTEGRNRPSLYRSIIKTCLANQLEQSALSTTYSAIVNPMISTRGYMSSALTFLLLDLKALRRGRVQVVKEVRGEYKDDGKDRTSIILQDSGRISNNTIVAIVNPTTRRLCSPNEMGEIWVCSPGNIDGLEYDDVRVPSSVTSPKTGNAPSPAEMAITGLSLTVEGVDPNLTFARTGDMGFLWPVALDASGGDDMLRGGRRRRSSGVDEARASISGWERLVLSGSPYEMVLFVVGSMAEAIEVNGLRHFPMDVEKTVEGSHPVVAQEGCVMFRSNAGELVCVVESTSEAGPTLLASVPRILSAVLEEHQFLFDVVCFVKQGHLARSRLQEKQRSRIKLAFHLGKL
ncbi:hypothetical protein HDU96_006560 [Phlyctochytrium bullatum]|nr:hypothetical protein HDU96_006560 [Phlyctochytrium bullatum]